MRAAPEVAVDVFKRTGTHTVDAKIIDYGAMIPAPKAGQFDIVAAGFTIRANFLAAKTLRRVPSRLSSRGHISAPPVIIAGGR